MGASLLDGDPDEISASNDFESDRGQGLFIGIQLNIPEQFARNTSAQFVLFLRP